MTQNVDSTIINKNVVLMHFVHSARNFGQGIFQEQTGHH